MLNQKAYFNINIIILITLALMVSFWLLATPKIDIIKSVQDLPKLTIRKLTPTSNNAQQNSQVSKKAVVDQKALAKLSTQSIKNPADLEKISKDVETSDISNLETATEQIDTEVQ